MVCISKSAIKCPSPNCDFAYFASGLDPACKLRNHFNNFKVRDAEHDAFFKKPHCLFCGQTISSKTRKGLWKSCMNQHWLLSHATEFEEASEQHDAREIEIAVLLSPSQLQRLTVEWQLEYELEEGDLITRNGRTTHLRQKMVIATKRSQKDAASPLKRQRTSYEQAEPDRDPNSRNSADEFYPTDGGKRKREILVNSRLPPESSTTGAAVIQSNVTVSPIESYSADAFSAMTYCFPGFEDDMTSFLENDIKEQDEISKTANVM